MLDATTGAAATPAAVVHTNWRRDKPAAGRQHGQLKENECNM
jgi:hypothetical protein